MADPIDTSTATVEDICAALYAQVEKDLYLYRAKYEIQCAEARNRPKERAIELLRALVAERDDWKAQAEHGDEDLRLRAEAAESERDTLAAQLSEAEAKVREMERLVTDLQEHANEHGWQDCDDPIAALLEWPASRSKAVPARAGEQAVPNPVQPSPTASGTVSPEERHRS